MPVSLTQKHHIHTILYIFKSLAKFNMFCNLNNTEKSSELPFDPIVRSGVENPKASH